VEILSPGTMGKDRFDKKKAYKEAGVLEYWLVDPNNEAVEIYENIKGLFEPFSFAAEEGTVKSKILKGFELNVKDIFEK
jgi:Uma2 family endonuclease